MNRKLKNLILYALAAGFALATAFPVLAQPTNGSTGADFSLFQVIAQRNIFDPNRYPQRSENYRPRSSRTAPAFSLVGAMSYRKGMFAFFDGTDPDYQRAVENGGKIADYTVTNITMNGVQLLAKGKAIHLTVGSAMRLEGDEWVLGQGDEGMGMDYSSTPAESNSPEEAPAPNLGSGGGEVSDVLKHLMQLRQQEEK